MGGKGKVLEASLGYILLMGLMMWFLLVGTSANRMVKKTKMTIESTAKFEPLTLIPKERVGVKWNSDPNYVSKRRVPTGPDPIHNRRVRKYSKPPGRV